jgi:hypothetical protein
MEIVEGHLGRIDGLAGGVRQKIVRMKLAQRRSNEMKNLLDVVKFFTMRKTREKEKS